MEPRYTIKVQVNGQQDLADLCLCESAEKAAEVVRALLSAYGVEQRIIVVECRPYNLGS